MKTYSEVTNLTALDPANLQDGIRAEKMRLDKKDEGFSLVSINATLGALLSKIIERLWNDTAEKRANFKLDLSRKDSNIGDEILIQCQEFLVKELVDAYSIALADPELRVLHERAKVLLELGGNPETVDRVIVRNLATGFTAAVGMAEVACELADWKCHDQEEAKKLMKEILSGKRLLGLIASIGACSRAVGNNFMESVAYPDVVKMRDGNMRTTLRANAFELIEQDGVKAIKVRPEIMAEIKALHQNEFDREKTNGICPAALARGNDGVVLSDFIRWLLQQMNEHYVPAKPMIGLQLLEASA